MPYRTWIEISEDALRHNAAALFRILDPGVVFCANVKANAYGHGLEIVVPVLASVGVHHFMVDTIDEAERIRALAADATIIISSLLIADDVSRAIEIDAMITVAFADEVRMIADKARELRRSAQIAFEIETGLHGIGAGERAYGPLYDAVKAAQGRVFIQGLSSAFANVEETSRLWEAKRQNTIFCDAINFFQNKGIFPPYKHLANSAASIMHAEAQHTLLRFGCMLYGLWPSGDVRREGTLGRRHAELKPVMAFKTRIAQVKDVIPGSGIGHGPLFLANRSMRIAVLPVGYADGLDRKASNNGFVIIKGAKCPILGAVSMNSCVVDIGGAPTTVSAGDAATLIGRDGISTITIDEWAQRFGTVHYEIVTRLGTHIPRVRV